MELAFYGSSVVAILATLGVISGTNPMHALLYLIVSLIAVGMIFFSLGASFVGAMQVIVYAGAIMVLFVFVVMMLNLGTAQEQERQWMKLRTWVGPLLLSAGQMAVFYVALHGITGTITGEPITAKQVGIGLYGPYVLAVELASLLLLAGLVAAYHLGRETRRGDIISTRNEEDDA
jgi:NADH-quinone oxidoreductase subunit J